MRIITLITTTLVASIAMVAACGGGGSGTTAPPPVGPPPSGSTLISNIQGDGDTSPMDGQTVTVAGLVTGDFQENDADARRNLGGFYMQDAPPDFDFETSDGIFVFDGSNPSLDVDVGDLVEVEGAVAEYFGETQINATSVRVVGTGAVKATPVNLPVAGSMTNSDGDVIADLERFEGMLVEFSDPMIVTHLRNLERYGAVTLSDDERLYQFTNSSSPDAAGYAAHKDLKARRSIELDDGLRSQNPDDIHYLEASSSTNYSIRVGDRLTGLVGNLRYSRGSGSNGDETWRLMPTTDPDFESLNPRPGAPSIGGTTRVAGVNLLNLFSTLDTGSDICGAQSDQGCRGANSQAELTRQLGKAVTALIMMDVDIVGVTEIENNSDASLNLLVDALNARLGSPDYAFVDTGTIHDDVIKGGFIYRTTTVSTTGNFALLDRSVDSRFNDDRNRPALAQSFAVDATGAVFTVVVNHLKSKGSPCDADGDPNLNDGQGNCNTTRDNAAAALAEWVGTDPTGSGDDDVLIIGDFNAYLREDPIETLVSAGLTNLIDSQAQPYSYLFDGQTGAYDYAFASSSLAPQVAETIEWHINADEPPLLDYNLEFGRDPSLFDANVPYRASDHDPVIVGLDLAN